MGAVTGVLVRTDQSWGLPGQEPLGKGQIQRGQRKPSLEARGLLQEGRSPEQGQSSQAWRSGEQNPWGALSEELQGGLETEALGRGRRKWQHSAASDCRVGDLGELPMKWGRGKLFYLCMFTVGLSRMVLLRGLGGNYCTGVQAEIMPRGGALCWTLADCSFHGQTEGETEAGAPVTLQPAAGSLCHGCLDRYVINSCC